MENKYDIIIIGAGLGGLTAGATLAKAGKKVLVLEQHNIVGGCATTFERKGVKFEVGLHEMEGQPKSKDTKYPIFKKLGIYDKIQFVKSKETWRVKTDSFDITIPHGHKNVINELSKYFPEERKNLKKYFASMNRIAYMSRRLPYDLKFWDFFFYPITTLPLNIYHIIKQHKVGDVLDKTFKNNRLKRLLDVNLGYYHDNPYEFCWFFHAFGQSGYYNNAYFIKGGSQELSNSLADIIIKNGGEVKTLTDVVKINLDGNKAKGVTYIDRKTKNEITVEGKKIISNSAPYNVYKNMLPSEFEDKKITSLENSSSLYSIYLIFKKNFSSIYKGNAYSTFVGPDSAIDAPYSDKSKTYKVVDIVDRGALLVDYSAIDSGLVKEGDDRSFAALLGVSYLDEWENLTKEEYKQKKEKLAQDVFDRFEKHYPGFKDNIEYYEVSTPKTIKRYTRAPGGTAYGFKQNDYANKGRAGFESSTVKNLYFVGVWGFPGGGFSGAIINGYFVAKHILFNIKAYTIYRIILCSIVGTIFGTAHSWLPLITKLFIK